MVGIRDRDWRRGSTGPVSVPAGNIRPFSLFDTILCCGRWTATKAAPMIDELPAHVAVGDCLVDRQTTERTRQIAEQIGRASRRERVFQNVELSVEAVELKKK